MVIASKMFNAAVRARYLVLLAWSLPWLLHGLSFHEPHGDWLYLEIGARTLLRHHASSVAGPPLHVYADNPEVQMGPPALVVGGLFQWLPEQLGAHAATVLLALAVLPALWLLERSVTTAGVSHGVSTRTLLAGLVAVPAWTYEAQYWGHIDDVLALLGMAVVCLLVSQGRHELLAGVVLGSAAAAKPWAVILLPLLFAYPRLVRPRAVLAFVVGALAWWLPFVLADPATVHELGSLSLPMVHETTWRLLGIRGPARPWIRPLQLLGGVVVATVAARRTGWQAVPLIALAWRVTTDPYDWAYYVMGPLIGAALWDIQRRGRHRWSCLPWATLSALLADLLVERELPAVEPAVRLLWLLGLITCVLVEGARRARPGAGAAVDAASAAHPAASTAVPVPAGLE